MDGRTYVSPHDIKSMAHDILRHRIVLSYEAEAQEKSADDIIDESWKPLKYLRFVVTDLSVLQQVRTSNRTNRQVANVLAGAYLSVFKGFWD